MLRPGTLMPQLTRCSMHAAADPLGAIRLTDCHYSQTRLQRVPTHLRHRCATKPIYQRYLAILLLPLTLVSSTHLFAHLCAIQLEELVMSLGLVSELQAF